MFTREFDNCMVKLKERMNYIGSLTQDNPLSMRNELEDISNIVDDMMGEIDRFLDPEGEDKRDYENWQDRMDYESGI